MAIDSRQDLDRLAGLHPLQKPPDRLKVPVTTFDVPSSVDLPLDKVKVNLSRAHDRARNRRDVPDTIGRFVRQDFEIVTYSHCSNC